MNIKKLILQICRNLCVCLFVIVLYMPSYGQIGIFSTSHETVSEKRINAYFTITTWQVFDLYLGDKEYVLNYTIGAEDMIRTSSISYGTYNKNDNGFVLDDLVNGYTMAVEYVNDSSLVFTKGPYCMKDRLLTWQPWDQELYEEEKITDFNYDQLETERQTYSNQQALSNTIIGDYSYGALYGDDFSPLVLREDSSYELRYNSGNVLLSKGQWSRQGNLLLLQDEYMDKPIYALIEVDSIMFRFFIGDWRRLYKKN